MTAASWCAVFDDSPAERDLMRTFCTHARSKRTQHRDARTVGRCGGNDDECAGFRRRCAVFRRGDHQIRPDSDSDEPKPDPDVRDPRGGTRLVVQADAFRRASVVRTLRVAVTVLRERAHSEDAAYDERNGTCAAYDESQRALTRSLRGHMHRF